MRKFALVVVLVACGDDGTRHTPDAAHPADGAPDSPADAAVTPVTLTALRDGQPVMGVHVYFQNADSTVVLATTTDASGTASAVMTAGGYVTAVNPYTLPAFGSVQTAELDTFVAVKPGDHLVLKRSFISTGITVSVQAPGDAAMTNFSATTPCNYKIPAQLSPPLSVIAPPVSGQATLSNCGSATDFLVFATNGSASEFIYTPNQAVADQGNVDLTAGTYVPATQRTITYTNVPALRSMSMQDDLLDTMGPIFETGGETASDTIDPVVTLDMPLFAGALDVVQTSFNNRSFSQQVTVDWGQLGSAATIDIGARALYDFSGSPMLDPATKAASVAVDTSAGTAPDFSVLSISASRGISQWKWLVTAPYGASITLPTVPTDLFDFNIATTDTYGIDSWVAGKVPGGYDAVRAFVLSVQPYLYNIHPSPQDLVLGGSGAATFVESQQALAVTRRVLRHRTR